MKTLLMAVAVASMFAACKTNSKTDEEIVEKASLMGVVDTTKVQRLPEGTKRVVVVERKNADGSRTVTTTTDVNANNSSDGKTNPVSAPSEVKSTSNASNVPVATTVKKKGWSSRAKGAVIGGVGGAAVGVATSKNKVKGGILGGAIGAGGGYIIGNEIERKKVQ